MKYTRRQATIIEMELAGFKVDGEKAQAPDHAWFSVEEIFVGNSATINGERVFGNFLYIDSELPLSQDFLFKLPE